MWNVFKLCQKLYLSVSTVPCPGSSVPCKEDGSTSCVQTYLQVHQAVSKISICCLHVGKTFIIIFSKCRLNNFQISNLDFLLFLLRISTIQNLCIRLNYENSRGGRGGYFGGLKIYTLLVGSRDLSHIL